MKVRVPDTLSNISSRMGRCLNNPPPGLYQPCFMLSKGVRIIWTRIRWRTGSLCARRRHWRRPGGRTRRSKESNWGRMRKDQQKWGWKRGGGREDTGVVSLSCKWPGMSSCALFGQLSFPNDKSVIGEAKRVVISWWTRRLRSRGRH